MQGDVDFVQPGGGEEQLFLLLQQRPVGGENHPEASFSRNLQKSFQLGMEQRLAHQMKI